MALDIFVPHRNGACLETMSLFMSRNYPFPCDTLGKVDGEDSLGWIHFEQGVVIEVGIERWMSRSLHHFLWPGRSCSICLAALPFLDDRSNLYFQTRHFFVLFQVTTVGMAGTADITHIIQAFRSALKVLQDGKRGVEAPVKSSKWRLWHEIRKESTSKPAVRHSEMYRVSSSLLQFSFAVTVIVFSHPNTLVNNMLL